MVDRRRLPSNRASPRTPSFRWACNKRLGNALATLAHNSRRSNPWAADLYAQARARGHSHPRALRPLGRAWAQIIWRCGTAPTPYDPERHTGLQRHITVTIPDPSDPRPDLAATQRMARAAVTADRPAKAQRAALDRKPPAAIPARA